MKWFKFYGQDWLTDLKVIDLSAMDRLCYITLLCMADDNGIIRGFREDRIIQLMHLSKKDMAEVIKCGFEKTLIDNGMITKLKNGDVIIPKFKERQSTSLTAYERIKRFREKQKKNGQSIGLFPNDNDIDNASDNGNDNVETRIDKTRIDKKIPFDLFWAIYPKKVDKKKTEVTWGRLSLQKQQSAMADLPVRVKSLAWTKDGGRYVPNPRTYLNGEKWEDEIPVESSASLGALRVSL